MVDDDVSSDNGKVGCRSEDTSAEMEAKTEKNSTYCCNPKIGREGEIQSSHRRQITRLPVLKVHEKLRYTTQQVKRNILFTIRQA